MYAAEEVKTSELSRALSPEFSRKSSGGSSGSLRVTRRIIKRRGSASSGITTAAAAAQVSFNIDGVECGMYRL